MVNFVAATLGSQRWVLHVLRVALCAEDDGVARTVRMAVLIVLFLTAAAVGSVACRLVCDAVLFGQQLPTVIRNVTH